MRMGRPRRLLLGVVPPPGDTKLGTEPFAAVRSLMVLCSGEEEASIDTARDLALVLRLLEVVVGEEDEDARVRTLFLEKLKRGGDVLMVLQGPS